MRKALIGILMAATVATPLAAQENERGWRQNRGQHSERDNGDRGERGNRGGRQQQQAAPQQQAPRQAAPQAQAPQQQRNYSRGEGRQQWQGNRAQWQGNQGQGNQGQRWQGRDGRNGQQSTLDRQGVTPEYQRQGERNQQRYGRSQAQRDWQEDRRRDNRYRDDRRDNDRYWNNNSNGNWRGDRGRQSYSWNRGWRNDNRYDWQRYRYSNRNIFRGGPYYSPYRNYRYNRLGIGVFLDSLFYSRNYWISDPYQYRLPASPPGTQWVRYYNDVVLVDVYTGEVLDTIYDFFW